MYGVPGCSPSAWSDGHQCREVIRGTVQRCNGSSVVLHERDEPLVISRYAKNLPTLEGGDRVELSVDSRDSS
jgi:hypothetical protein